ncbi:MAG: Cof-type HAD-IIB family hydrolase [Armatimonadetes bacterium]|nr:Cof-type HAD-IIB family hydrolase [Armatimonadota bacterium]
MAIDLDGTLVRNDENRVEAEDAEAIRKVQAAGVHVVIATGRPHKSAEELLRRIGLPDAYVISFNGAMVKRCGDDKPLMHLTLSPELAREVVEMAVHRHLYLLYFSGDEIYVTHMSKWGWIYWKRTGLRPEPAGDLRGILSAEATKIVMMDEPERLARLAKECEQRWSGRLYVTPSRPDILEFMPLSANKGAALSWLAERLGVPLAETLALGDSRNDIPLLEAAGFAVAMASADDTTKGCADMVAADAQAPVAEVLHKLVLAGSARPS